MNKPTTRIEPNDDIGPLDEHGQQIWSPEEEAAIARMHDDPEFWAGIAEAEADIAAGRIYTTKELRQELEKRRRARRAQG